MLERGRVVGIRSGVKDLRNMLALGIWVPIGEPSLEPWIRSHIWVRNHGFLNRHWSRVGVILRRENVLLSGVWSCWSLVLLIDNLEGFIGIRFHGFIPGIRIGVGNGRNRSGK